MTKKNMYIIAGIVLVLVLAGAVFMSTRLFFGGLGAFSAGANGTGMIMPNNGKNEVQAPFSIAIENAPEIPQQKAQLNGIINNLTDNGFVVSDGGKLALPESSGSTEIISDGPLTEVVVAKETIIYIDTTFDSHMPQSGEKVKQIIKPYTKSQIETKDIVDIWGTKRGDRLVADFILVNHPKILKQGSGN